MKSVASKMCNCGTIIVCCILFAIAIAVAIYYGVFNVDDSAPEVGDFIKKTGDSIKHGVHEGVKKFDD